MKVHASYYERLLFAQSKSNIHLRSTANGNKPRSKEGRSNSKSKSFGKLASPKENEIGAIEKKGSPTEEIFPRSPQGPLNQIRNREFLVNQKTISPPMRKSGNGNQDRLLYSKTIGSHVEPNKYFCEKENKFQQETLNGVMKKLKNSKKAGGSFTKEKKSTLEPKKRIKEAEIKRENHLKTKEESMWIQNSQKQDEQKGNNPKAPEFFEYFLRKYSMKNPKPRVKNSVDDLKSTKEMSSATNNNCRIVTSSNTAAGTDLKSPSFLKSSSPHNEKQVENNTVKELELFDCSNISRIDQDKSLQICQMVRNLEQLCESRVLDNEVSFIKNISILNDKSRIAALKKNEITEGDTSLFLPNNFLNITIDQTNNNIARPSQFELESSLKKDQKLNTVISKTEEDEKFQNRKRVHSTGKNSTQLSDSDDECSKVRGVAVIPTNLAETYFQMSASKRKRRVSQVNNRSVKKKIRANGSSIQTGNGEESHIISEENERSTFFHSQLILEDLVGEDSKTWRQKDKKAREKERAMEKKSAFDNLNKELFKITNPVNQPPTPRMMNRCVSEKIFSSAQQQDSSIISFPLKRQQESRKQLSVSKNSTEEKENKDISSFIQPKLNQKEEPQLNPQQRHIIPVDIIRNESFFCIPSKCTIDVKKKQMGVSSLPDCVVVPKKRRKTFIRNITDAISDGAKNLLSDKWKNSYERMRCDCDIINSAATCGRMARLIKTFFKEKSLVDLKKSFEGLKSKNILNPQHSRQIILDLPRTFPEYSLFTIGSKGYSSLENILVALVNYNPEIGYVQGMNFIAASLIYHSEEYIAFWVLIGLFKKLSMHEIYSPNLPGLKKHTQLIDFLILQGMPTLYSKMCMLSFSVEVCTMEWIFCLFTSVVPLEQMGAFFERLFNEGWIFFYRVVLSIFLNLEPIINECKEYSDLIITFRRLTKRNLTSSKAKKKKKRASNYEDFESKLEDFDIDWEEVLEDVDTIKIDGKLINRLHSAYDYERQVFRIEEI